jgi:hypothetical protein
MSEILTARLGVVTFVATRLEVQRVAVHVVSRERHAREGRIGLKVVPGGIGTDVLQIVGTALVRGDRECPIRSMRELADFAGVDLDAPFSAGHDTPALGEDAVHVDPEETDALLGWFSFAWSVLEEIATGPITLWPEHFDCAFVHEERANVGASPGDSFSAEPYLYVGPWTADRPGDPSYWNAPFGAVTQTTDRDDALAFYRRGLALLQA